MRVSSKQYLETTSQLSVNGENSQNELFAKLGARKCFRDADANRDNVITKDEVTLSAEAFARLDASRDGKVTQEEITAAMAGHGKEVYSHFTSRRRAGTSQELLSSILGSAKQDGGTAAEQAAREYVTRKDANKDGVLSKNEAALSAAAFTKIDTSANGTIEFAEMSAALKVHDSRLSAYFTSRRESAAPLRKKI